MVESLFISVAEVAELLALPESTLRFWSWQGAWPKDFPVPVKVGRRVLYPRARLTAWAEGQIAKTNGGGPA